LAQNPVTLDLNSPMTKHQIAQKMIDLQVCTQQKQDLQASYDDCAYTSHAEPWTPEFLIGGVVVTMALTTVVICLTHVLGACQ
jgi:hypothetical protein